MTERGRGDMENPFGVPEMEDPRAELRPWEHPSHEELYVLVDSVGPNMQEFRKHLATQPFGGRRGKLIVITGESDSGKTSLAHWCAYQIDKATNRARKWPAGAFVVDLTSSYYLGRTLRGAAAVDERAAQLCGECVKDLKRTLGLREDLVARSRRPDGYFGVYAELNQLGWGRRSPFTPIVILPDSEYLLDDLDLYIHLAREFSNIAFIVESSDAAVYDSIRGAPSEHGRIMRLHLGSISEDDGWLFVTHCLSRSKLVPEQHVSEESVRSLIRELQRGKDTARNSILRLRFTLHEAWKLHEGEAEPWITAEELLDIGTRSDSGPAEESAG